MGDLVMNEKKQIKWDFTSPWSNIRKWSKTRDNCWEECKRKYYYEYIAIQKKSTRPEKDKIKELKKLKTLPILKGEIVHEAIANYIRESVEAGAKDAPMAYFEYIWKIKEGNFKYSLVEITNGQEITNAQLIEAKSDCRILISNFEEIWPTFAEKEIMYLDDPSKIANWFMCGKFGVYAKPDLIVKDEKYIIIDWKTGQERDDDAENNLQLSASVFLACFDEKGAVRNFPNEFVGYFYYLKTKSYSEPAMRTLDDYRAFIEYVDKRMNIIPESLEAEGYAPSPIRWKCTRCQFATICKEGQVYLDQ